jgi:hypothetical protein
MCVCVCVCVCVYPTPRCPIISFMECVSVNYIL